MDDSIDVDRWTLSSSERAPALAKRSENRLGFALLLKHFAAFGRFPASLAQIDTEIQSYVADQVDIPVSRSLVLTVRTEERYRAEIRAFLGFREATRDDARDLALWLRDHAVSESRDREHLTGALEVECRRRMIEPPAADRIDRVVRAAVRAYEERFYASICSRLSPPCRTRLDELLRLRAAQRKTPAMRRLLDPP